MGTLPCELVYIDHHISAIKEVEEYLNKNVACFAGLRNTNFAACELTWNYFFPGKPVPELVRLLGLIVKTLNNR